MRPTGCLNTEITRHRLYSNYVCAVPKEIKAMLEKLRTQNCNTAYFGGEILHWDSDEH
jgi:coproporphyrinogen III oxidase-like Fe-S oxidoreductase